MKTQQQSNILKAKDKRKMDLIEAALYAAGRPLDIDTLSSLTNEKSEEIVKSLAEIKKYLDRKGKRYELKAVPWHDIEDQTWEENIISVKIECKDNKEKRKIWDEIDKIVRKYENKRVVVLTRVDKYELS